MGRPSDITKVVGQRRDDQGTDHPITVADRIVNALKAGNYFEQAVAQGGQSKETGYEWLRVGAKCLLRAQGRPVDECGFTDHELACVAFSDAVAEADALWEVGQNATLEQLGRGGIPIVTQTVKRAADNADGSPGPVLEVTTRTTHSLPDAQVIEWRLERRHPDRYGRRVEVAIPPGGLSLEERAAALLDGFEELEADAYMRGAADGAAAARSDTPAKPKRAPRPRKPRAATKKG